MSVESVSQPDTIMSKPIKNTSVSDISCGITIFDRYDQNYFNDQFNPIPDLKTLNSEQLVWYDKIIRQVLHSGEPLLINEQKFYLKLWKNEKCKDSLEDHYSIDQIKQGFLVAAHTTVIKGKTGNPVSKFSLFPSPAAFLYWLRDIPKHEWVYFEVILDVPQKFKIDIDGSPLKENEIPAFERKYKISAQEYHSKYLNDQYIQSLIERLIDNYQKHFGKLNLETDVALWTSSDHIKKSFHIIFTNIMYENHVICKKIYEKLVEGFNEIERKIVDSSIYHSVQQFRSPFNQKLGSGRFKLFCKQWYYHGNLITHKYYNEQLPEMMVQFLESTVSFDHKGLSIVNPFPDPIDPEHKIIKNGRSNNLIDEIDMALFNDITTITSTLPFRDQFTIGEFKNGQIRLNRIKPGLCPLHDRVHENDNYFLNIYKDGGLLFTCPRDPFVSGFIIGRIKVKDEITPDSANEQSTIVSDPNNPETTESSIDKSKKNSKELAISYIADIPNIQVPGDHFYFKWEGPTNFPNLNPNATPNFKLTKDMILRIFRGLSKSRAISDKDIEFKFTRNDGRDSIDVNYAGACLKAVIDINGLTQQEGEEIKREWSLWISKLTHSSSSHWVSEWNEYRPYHWSNKILLTWYRADRPIDFQQFQKEYPEVVIENLNFNPLVWTRNIVKGYDEDGNKISVDLDKDIIEEIYDEPTVRDYDINIPTEIVQAPMDSQKTVKSMKMVREMRANIVYYFTHRVLQGIDMKERFSKELLKSCEEDGWAILPEIIFYQDVDDWSQLRSKDNYVLIIQMESIHHLNLPPPEVSIIDEATSCAAEFSSSTMNKNHFKENFSKYQYIIRNTSRKVLFLDADIDKRVMNLAKLRQGLIRFQKNLKVRGPKRVVDGKIVGLNATIFLDEDTLINQLLTLVLIHGKNVFVPCSIKSFAKDLEALLKKYGVKVITHTADDTKEEKDQIQNVNELWVQYQVVIGTNVLAGGVNFDHEHFHYIVAFLHNRGAPFRLMKQVIGRSRKVLDGEIFIHVTQHSFSLPLSPDTIKHSIENKIWSCSDSLLRSDKYKTVGNTIVAADFEVGDTAITSLDEYGCMKTTYEESWISQNHCLTTHEKNKSMNDYMSLVLDWCKHDEFPVTVIQYSYFPLWLPEFRKEIRKQRKEEKIQKFKDTRSIDPGEATVVHYRVKKGEEEDGDVEALERYSVEKYFKDPPVIYEDFSYFKNHKMNLLHLTMEEHKDYIDVFKRERDAKKMNNSIELEASFDQLDAIQQFCSLINIPQTFKRLTQCTLGDTFYSFDTQCLKTIKEHNNKNIEVNEKTRDVMYKLACAFKIPCKEKIQRLGAAVKIIKKAMIKWSGAKVEKLEKTRKGSGNLRTQTKCTRYRIATSPRMLGMLEKIKPFNTPQSLLTFIQNDNIQNDSSGDTTLHQKHLESIKLQLKIHSESTPVSLISIVHTPDPVPDASLGFKEQLNNMIISPNQPNGIHVNPVQSKTLEIVIQHDSSQNQTQHDQTFNVSHYIPINRLELLVDFTLKHYTYFNPQHLTKRIREVGYRKAFRSLKLKSKPVTDSIDHYLKSLRITGLNWKSLDIKPDTVFPNEKTKYDQ